jgi:hypothetical protein
MNNQQQQSIHWLAVGKVSDAVSREVVRTGGQVVYLASEPTITLVGIAHNGTRTDDLAFNNASEIQIDVHSTGLTLVWASSDRLINAAFSNVSQTSLITYSEYEDVLTGRAADTAEETLPDSEDRPF